VSKEREFAQMGIILTQLETRADQTVTTGTITLAAALGARALAHLGVLPTRLSAVDEAASIEVLCVDKTGTLTRNELKVTAIHPMAGFDEPHVLGLAALASSDGGQEHFLLRPSCLIIPRTGQPPLISICSATGSPSTRMAALSIGRAPKCSE
jgi:hypothetical protein